MNADGCDWKMLTFNVSAYEDGERKRERNEGAQV